MPPPHLRRPGRKDQYPTPSINPGDIASLAVVAASTVGAQTTAEDATVARFEAVRGDSARLLAFLRAMPKGADVHSHLSGAVLPEN